MKMIMVAIKDLGAQCFSRPQYYAHSNQAIRSFFDEVNRPATAGSPNDLFSHPDDFELYELGVFNDADGSFEILKSPKLLSQAKEVRESK